MTSEVDQKMLMSSVSEYTVMWCVLGRLSSGLFMFLILKQPVFAQECDTYI